MFPGRTKFPYGITLCRRSTKQPIYCLPGNVFELLKQLWNKTENESNKRSGSLPLFKNQKSIAIIQIRFTNWNKENTSTLKKHWSATKTNNNLHRNALIDYNYHIIDLVQDISIKNGWLNLVLLLAKHSAYMTMLKYVANITTPRDRNTGQTNARTHSTENRTNQNIK